jgi:hypothetical protein
MLMRSRIVRVTVFYFHREAAANYLLVLTVMRQLPHVTLLNDDLARASASQLSARNAEGLGFKQEIVW